MTRIVEAVYEDGVLKPLDRLELPEGKRVKILVLGESVVDVAREIRARARKRLREVDLVEELSRDRSRL